jgi:outer membrane usher protein
MMRGHSEYSGQGSAVSHLAANRGAGLLLLIVALLGVSTARAELYFNVNALKLTPAQKADTDLETLSRPDIQMPGEYAVQVSVNRVQQGEYTLKFIVCGTRLCPELTPALLQKFGVNVGALPALVPLSPEAILTDIGAVIPDAETQFDFERRVLELTLPQAALNQSARGDVPPEQWDDGLPMFFASYSASGSEIRNQSPLSLNQSSQYLNLRSGVNLGPWRLRNYSTYSRTSNTLSQWNSMQTSVERDVRPLRARFVAGETATPGLVMDSFSFRGAWLATQDEMLADSQRGYAPEIRGIALSHATVEVRQNGNLLYQTFVSPGAFVINDLYPTSSSGDLDITVKEEDGSVRTYTQSFASPPISVRRGMFKYSVTAGEYGTRNNVTETSINQRFVQGEMLYGLLNNTTVYGGTIVGEHYRAGMLGVGQSLGTFGAISLDMTHAATTFSDGSSKSGQSLQAKYSKRFDATGTSMTLAGYRYATDGYYGFDEASDYYQNSHLASRYTLKSKSQITLNQNAGRAGSVALSAYQSEYWNRSNSRNRSVTGSWSKSFSGVTVSLNQSQSRLWRNGRTDNSTSVNVSLPIGKWLSPNSESTLRMSNNWSQSNRGTGSLSTTLTGTAMENNNLSWSLSQARNRQSDRRVNNSTALSGSLQGSNATASLGYTNYYGESETVNWGLRGSVVVHPYGVTLSRELAEGSSWALVRAPGGKDIKIKNRSGLSTDSRGYAIVPSLTPYRENDVTLDTSSLGEDVDLKQSIQRKTPSRESLVLAEYETRVGLRVFLTLTRNGKPLPLASVVRAGDISGITDEQGRVYLAGVAESAQLEVSLAGGEPLCTVPFSAKGRLKNNGIIMADLPCDALTNHGTNGS